MSQQSIQDNDIQIRRKYATSNLGTREFFFTVHAWPAGGQVAGPFPDEQKAKEAAFAIAKEQGVNVWLQSGADPNQFICIT